MAKKPRSELSEYLVADDFSGVDQALADFEAGRVSEPPAVGGQAAEIAPPEPEVDPILAPVCGYQDGEVQWVDEAKLARHYGGWDWGKPRGWFYYAKTARGKLVRVSWNGEQKVAVVVPPEAMFCELAGLPIDLDEILTVIRDDVARYRTRAEARRVLKEAERGGRPIPSVSVLEYLREREL